MSYDNSIAIRVINISKFFEIYEKPYQRLLQMLFHGRRQFYRPFWALSGISFDILQGECIGVIGRNGAGKSTLLQIITGTLTSSTGNIYTKGRIAALLELGSGFNPEFTGKENVYLNASLLGLSKNEIDRKYDDIINFSDIGEFIDQPVKSYSSGMVVRLAFAVIAHVDANILIIDEALSVGDAFFTQKCMRFLRNFMKENTVLFVSHDIAAVNSLCDRVVLLENGKIKKIGSPKEVTEIYLQDMFESIQGTNEIPDDNECYTSQKNVFFQTNDIKDMRLEFINKTQLRNDIKVFAFNDSGSFFGKGNATIENAILADESNTPLNWIVGGEIVTLHILCKAYYELFSPIVGFYIRDRLGQSITGDNTYLSFADKPFYVPGGANFTASFKFRMPVLAAGDYSFSIALAEGTQAEHVQHQWRHDAIIISSISTSVSTGILGIPMLDISLKILDSNMIG